MIDRILWTVAIRAKLMSERGAGLAEYALLLFLVAAAAAAIVGTLGTNIVAAITDTVDELPPPAP